VDYWSLPDATLANGDLRRERASTENIQWKAVTITTGGLAVSVQPRLVLRSRLVDSILVTVGGTRWQMVT
jgi:hypothetical protein